MAGRIIALGKDKNGKPIDHGSAIGAAIEPAKGAALQAEAALKRAQRNIGYCTIVSSVV